MKTAVSRRAPVSVADEAWIVLALLHREHPDREDFLMREILERARREQVTGALRPGVKAHLSFDAVANKVANPGKDRMVFATSRRGGRRLYRDGDPVDTTRTGKITPDSSKIPQKYRYLLDWYYSEYSPKPKGSWLQGIFEMAGADPETWKGVDADEYVRQLREGWD